MRFTSPRTSRSSTGTSGLLAALVFLEWNGYEVKDPAMRLCEAMIAIAERRLDKKGLATLIKELATPAK